MTANRRATDIAELLGHLVDLLAEQPTTPTPEPRPLPPRLLLTVEEAAEQLGIGRTLAWRLVSDGELESVRIGRLRRVPRSAIEDYAAQLIAQQSEHDTTEGGRYDS